MQDFLTFVKVSVVFVAVVFAMRKKVPIGLALFAGGLGAAFLMAKSPAWVARELTAGPEAILFSPHTRVFVSVMGLVVALSYVLDRSGQIARLTAAFRVCFRSPRWTLASLPAIMGLLPMPGGALFSAPMVESSAEGSALRPDDKSLVNYWYRHIWEYSWPLYPGILFSAQLMGMEVRTLSLYQAPLSLAAVLAGLHFLPRAAPPAAPEEGGHRVRGGLEAVVVLLPFFLIFVLYLALRLDLVLSVAAGFAAACLWHLAARNIAPRRLLKAVFANYGVLDMMLLGYGAKVFGELMMRSGAIDGISGFFQSMHLPVVVLAGILPLAVGFFSGSTIVYVMTTFPVLLAYPGAAGFPLPLLVFAFAAGFCGTLISPVHACLAMTNAFFKSDLVRVIRRMLVPCGIVLAAGLALMLLYGRARFWMPS